MADNLAEDLYLGVAIINLSEYYATQGKAVEAENLFKRGLAIVEKYASSEDLGQATHLAGLGQLLMDQGRFAEAEPLFKRALAIGLAPGANDYGDSYPDLSSIKDKPSLLISQHYIRHIVKRRKRHV